MHPQLRFSSFILTWLIVYTLLFALAGVILALLSGFPLFVGRVVVFVVALYILVAPQEVFLTALLPNTWEWSAQRSEWVYIERNLSVAGQRGGFAGILIGMFPFSLAWTVVTTQRIPKDSWCFILAVILSLLITMFVVLRGLSSSFERRWCLSTCLGGISSYGGLLFGLKVGGIIEHSGMLLPAMLGGACFGVIYATSTLLLLPWVLRKDPLRLLR